MTDVEDQSEYLFGEPSTNRFLKAFVAKNESAERLVSEQIEEFEIAFEDSFTVDNSKRIETSVGAAFERRGSLRVSGGNTQLIAWLWLASKNNPLALVYTARLAPDLFEESVKTIRASINARQSDLGSSVARDYYLWYAGAYELSIPDEFCKPCAARVEFKSPEFELAISERAGQPPTLEDLLESFKDERYVENSERIESVQVRTEAHNWGSLQRMESTGGIDRIQTLTALVIPLDAQGYIRLSGYSFSADSNRIGEKMQQFVTGISIRNGTKN